MLKKFGKVSVLTMIAALFVFAFACTAFAEDTDEGLLVQPEEVEAPDLPVGGWAPAEPVAIPDDFVIPGSESKDQLQSSKNSINADPYNVFTKGAAKTGYNALTAAQKQVYDTIDSIAINFMNATNDLQPTRITLNGEYVDRYIIDGADYSGIPLQDALKAFYAYDYDHPAYYWISNEVLYNGQYIIPCTEAEYASVSAREALNTLVSTSVKAYADFAAQGTDRLDTIALVHDRIVKEIDYAYKSGTDSPEPAKWAHSVHGVFDPNYKSAVCEGYADAFALIMNYMEIPNYYIVGEAGSGGAGGNGGHAWNAVYDDAAKCYLYMDLTWDDLGKDENGEDAGYSYAYFGMPMTNFEKSHFEYTSNAELGLKWLYDIPGDYNNSFKGTYYNRGGFYYDGSTDVDAFAAAAKEKAARAGGWVSILCPDNASINAIAGELGVQPLYYIATYGNYNYGYLMASVYTPGFVLSPDYSEMTAYRITDAGNWNVGKQTETVSTNIVGTKDPTCTENGYTVCEAIFHTGDFAALSPVSKTAIRKALGHNWNAPTYQWGAKYSSVTARHVCSRDGYIETETAKTTSKITRAATYTAKGQRTYTAVFKKPGFSTQKKTVANVPMLNPIKVKATTKTVKYKKLKKKALTVAPLKVTYAKGKLSYKLVSGNAKSKKALKLNTKTGKITVKKKTKKGKYQIIVKVTAAGTASYRAGSKTMTVTVKVK